MRTRVEIDTPPAGTACAPCQRKRHFCPARVYRDDEPACPACAAGAECETSQALRRLREPWDQVPDHPMPPPVRRIEPATVLTVPDRAPAATPIEKESPMRTANLDRPLCKVLGCPNRASAKGSFCTSKHYYLLKKELAGEVVKPAAAKRNGEPEPLLPLPARMQPAMHTDHTGPEATEEERCPHCHFLDGRHHPTCFSIHSAEPQPDDDPDTAVNLTLRLTETQCDALYHRCTPGQKAIALSSLLHQLLAI